MTVTTKNLLEAKFAENSQTTQYTANGVRTIIDSFTASNGTGSAATLAINVVPSGGSAASSNLVAPPVSVAAGGTVVLAVMAGQILNPGDFISTLAGTASAIVIRINGRELTS